MIKYNPIVLFDRGAGDLDPEQQARRQDSRALWPDAVRDHLRKTLSSKTFVSSPQLCRFLRFLVEQEIAGHGEELKEYVLAIEVFRKDESFDPRVDTVVRTEARRLRQKLLQYYQSEGRDDAIEIILPKGSYRAVFQARPQVGSASSVSTAANTSLRWISVAICIVLAAATAYWLWARGQRAGHHRTPSIAVIPLENLSADPEQEYFADGMTDALVTDLAKIRASSVISRTSIMQYKRTKKRVPEIGRELNADYVVEGTVTRVGDRVRITAQLIGAPTDRHLWADSFERAGRDALTRPVDTGRTNMQLSTSKLISLAIVLTIVAANSIWHATQAKAQGRAASAYLAFGVIGIASGQTARLSAVTLGVRQEIPIELTLLDRNGNVLARTVERAAPGRAISVELPFIPGVSGNRLAIRGLVRWAAQLGPEEYVLPTLEVTDDATGRTAVLGGDPEG